MSKASIPMIAALLAAQTQNGSAWVANLPTNKLPLAGGRISSRLSMAGPFFGPEEEFDCPDEEGCEIDWDNMPGFDDDAETDIMEEEPIDANSFAAQALASMERGKVRLEVNWQIDECKTDVDRCEDFCEDCAGSGKQYCRFCRGTAINTFGDEFRTCLICKNGIEQCQSCRGTGHIAPWAHTMEDFMDGKSV